MPREVTSFCRFCGAACGVRLKIDEQDRIVDIRGDKANPLSQGYACFKGLQAEEHHHGPQRVTRPLRRRADGAFEEIPMATALDDVAEKLGRIIARDGGEAVAVISGGGNVLTSSAMFMYKAFLASIGSDQDFTVASIDQSAKVISFERLGGWAAGMQALDDSDVVLLVGTNPLVAHTTVGLLTTNPTRRLKEAKARGLNVICIDPRRSETARYAEVFLQPLPGHDALIVGAMLNVILTEGWHDAEFCAQFVGEDRMATLRSVLSGFDPADAEKRAGLMPGQIFEAAAMFARDNKRGSAFTATGPSMGPFSNLMQHMVDLLNVVCGRFLRAGDTAVVNPRDPARPIHAEVIAPTRSWDWDGARQSRLRGTRLLVNRERNTGTLADEILTPGKGQIRALIVDGCNAANCIPDQKNIMKAFQSLELLVVVDPMPTASAELAHYVIPPTMPYERPDLPCYFPGYPLQHDSFCAYTPALMAPPPGADVIDGWQFYYEVARRLGISIDDFAGSGPLDMENTPTSDDMIALLMKHSAIPLDEIKALPSGGIFDMPHAVVVPARAENDARFDVMPDDVRAECEDVLAWPGDFEGTGSTGLPFTHLLSSRRLRDLMNSSGTMLSGILKRKGYNPAFLHPDDMTAMGLQTGDRIEVASAHGAIEATVEPDADLRPGVINVSHGWGSLPGGKDRPGTNVNLLTNDKEGCQTINAMPRMSCLPVSIRRGRNIPVLDEAFAREEYAVPAE